jgi:membrane protein implicated in regulation of membrane protease activity
MNDECRRARQLLIGGAALSASGLAIAGTASPTFGGTLLVVGWTLLAYAIHRFGRSREGQTNPGSRSITR